MLCVGMMGHSSIKETEHKKRTRVRRKSIERQADRRDHQVDGWSEEEEVIRGRRFFRLFCDWIGINENFRESQRGVVN